MNNTNFYGKHYLTFLIVLILCSSHELFLKSDSYFLEANQQAELYLYNGTFDESENIITRDRMLNHKIVGPNFQYALKDSDFYDKGEVTFLQFETGPQGTYAAGISTKRRIIELDGQAFTDYLEHEGLSKILEKRAKNQQSETSARERYSKHVKAILQVGKARTAEFSHNFGYPIEFIPLQNPYELTVGDEISFRLLLEGEPLADQQVHISSRNSNSSETEPQETALLTDSKGQVTFEITKPGHWYIASIFMEEVEEENLDYESNWATLTFEIAE